MTYTDIIITWLEKLGLDPDRTSYAFAEDVFADHAPVIIGMDELRD